MLCFHSTADDRYSLEQNRKACAYTASDTLWIYGNWTQTIYMSFQPNIRSAQTKATTINAFQMHQMQIDYLQLISDLNVRRFGELPKYAVYCMLRPSSHMAIEQLLAILLLCLIERESNQILHILQCSNGFNGFNGFNGLRFCATNFHYPYYHLASQ